MKINKKILYVVFFLVLVVASLGWAKRGEFNAQDVLQNSKIKRNKVSLKVEEVKIFNDENVVYLIEDNSVELVAISFGFDKAGGAYEKKDGVSLLAQDLMLSGAGKYKREDVRKIMKEKGIKIDIVVTDDRLKFNVSYVKKFEKDALDLLKNILYQPSFNKEDLDIAKQQFNVVKSRSEESPSYQLSKLIKREFYGKHRYGKDYIPAKEDLDKVVASDIKEYLKDFMVRENLNIGVAGNVSKDEIKVILEDLFGGLVKNSKYSDDISFEKDFEGRENAIDFEVSKQSFVMFIRKGIDRLDNDFYPLYIADYIFGGSGLTSRLNVSIREKAGLTYGIYSYFSNSDAIDLWNVSFSSTPDNVEEIIRKFNEEYDNFINNGITKKELDWAKKSLYSSFNLRFSNMANMANMLEQMQAQKLGRDFLEKRQDYIQNIKLDDVNVALKKWKEEGGEFQIFRVNGKI